MVCVIPAYFKKVVFNSVLFVFIKNPWTTALEMDYFLVFIYLFWASPMAQWVDVPGTEI